MSEGRLGASAIHSAAGCPLVGSNAIAGLSSVGSGEEMASRAAYRLALPGRVEATTWLRATHTGELITRRVMGRPHEVMGLLEQLAPPVRAVYEAGPTGYGLARRGRAAGIDVAVCAPGMIARAGSERIKTDKRDAIKLARLHAAGQLVLVYVPTLEQEQLRDLARCREDARQDLMRAKHRVGKFLLRREIYYPGRGRAWTREHRAWLASLRFADAASEATFADYLHGPRHTDRAPRPARPRDR